MNAQTKYKLFSDSKGLYRWVMVTKGFYKQYVRYFKQEDIR